MPGLNKKSLEHFLFVCTHSFFEFFYSFFVSIVLNYVFDGRTDKKKTYIDRILFVAFCLVSQGLSTCNYERKTTTVSQLKNELMKLLVIQYVALSLTFFRHEFLLLIDYYLCITHSSEICKQNW